MLFEKYTIWFPIHSERKLLPDMDCFHTFNLLTPSHSGEYFIMTSLVNLKCSASLSRLLTLKNQKNIYIIFHLMFLRPNRCGVEDALKCQ